MNNDLINHPPHYNTGKIETFDFIKDQLTEEEFRGYIKGNVLKYISRERHKGADNDLRKALWYLEKLLNNEPATIVGPYGPRSIKRTAPSIMDVLNPFEREKIYEELNNASTTDINEKTGSEQEDEELSLDDTIKQIREKIRQRDTMNVKLKSLNDVG